MLAGLIYPALPELAPTLGSGSLVQRTGVVRYGTGSPSHSMTAEDSISAIFFGELLDLIPKQTVRDEIQDEAALLIVQRRIVQLAQLLICVYLKEMRKGVVDRRRFKRRFSPAPCR